MAITRKLVQISLAYQGSDVATITVTAIVSDDAENTATGVARVLTAPAVVTAANALRDAVVTAAANAGKPVTF